MTFPLATMTKGRIAVVCSLLSLDHACDGEEVILRLVGRNRARVIYADRCELAPECGCDGIPYFLPGDTVQLPADWHVRYGGQLDLSDLKIVVE